MRKAMTQRRGLIVPWTSNPSPRPSGHPPTRLERPSDWDELNYLRNDRYASEAIDANLNDPVRDRNVLPSINTNSEVPDIFSTDSRSDYTESDQRLIEGLMPGQERVITGFPEGGSGGFASRAGEYTHFDCSEIDPSTTDALTELHGEIPRGGWGTLGQGTRTTVERVDPSGHGYEVMEWGREWGERVADDIYEYYPHVSKTVNTRHDDYINRRAADEGAIDAAVRDHLDLHYTQHLPGPWKSAARGEGTGLGRVVKTLISYITPWSRGESDGTDGGTYTSSTMADTRGCVAYAGDVRGMTSRELAATLLIVPTESLARFYEAHPDEAGMMKGTIERIALSTGTPTPEEERFITSIMGYAQRDAMDGRVYDPRMIEMQDKGGRPSSGWREVFALRRRINDVRRILCDPNLRYRTYDTERLILPLALHMMEKGLPITVESVRGEVDGMMDTMRTIEVFNGGSMAVDTMGVLNDLMDPERRGYYSDRVIRTLIVSDRLSQIPRFMPVVYSASDGSMEERTVERGVTLATPWNREHETELVRARAEYLEREMVGYGRKGWVEAGTERVAPRGKTVGRVTR
jgi:hypothetical protein